MKDGKTCSLSLTQHTLHSHPRTHYRLRLAHHARTHTLSLPYSRLRTIAKLLPNCQAKFPEPHHISKLLSRLTGKQAFQQKRLSELTQYFESVSRRPQLQESQGFQQLLALACRQEQDSSSESNIPPAPRSVGLKLSARHVETVC